MGTFFGLLGFTCLVVAVVLWIIRLFSKNKMSAKKLGIFTGTAFVLFIIGICLPSSSTTTQPVATNQGSTSQPAAFDWSKSDITNDTVKQALNQKSEVDPTNKDDKFPADITSIDIENNETDSALKDIIIHYKPDAAWDETDLVQKAGGTAIVAGSLLFKNNKIGEVIIFTNTDMTDQYGKTADTPAIKIVLNQDLASKVDWKGLSDKHLLDPGNIYRIAADYYIHPGIMKNVKSSDVKL